MTGLKQLDEEFGSDRMIEVETDDEENQAERDCENEDEDDTDSDCTVASRHSSNPAIDSSLSWPQSFRLSMDRYTSVASPSVSFLKGGSLLSPTCKRSDASVFQSSLTKPFISETSLDKEEVPTSTLPVKLSATSDSRFTLSEVPPPELCSYGQSVLNAMNLLCGIGILSMPYALKEGGWLSLVFLFIFAIITCYTGILLKNCLESSPGLQTYPDIGQAAFGAAGRICIAVSLIQIFISSCVEYLIMMSDNLSALFPNSHADFAGIYLDSYQICAIVSTIAILPTVWLRNLSLLSYISAGGVLTLAAVVLCLLWVGIVDGVGFHPGGKTLDVANLPVTIGLIGFCYGSHSVFPNIYSSMKEPSLFPSVLLISFSMAGVLYMGVAVCGFLMFGDSTKSQFTLNMPTKFAASEFAAWTVVIAPVTKYALTITPVAFGLEELLPSARHRSHGVSIIIRTILVISTLVVALTVPYFGSVMALIGSLLVMLVALIFPCACYLRILHGRLTKFQIGVCSSIISVGLVSAIIGTYSAITSIAEQKNYGSE
ncbi:hypothetical protein LguiA_016267 [Lonicera macranthoides]